MNESLSRNGKAASWNLSRASEVLVARHVNRRKDNSPDLFFNTSTEPPGVSIRSVSAFCGGARYEPPSFSLKFPLMSPVAAGDFRRSARTTKSRSLWSCSHVRSFLRMSGKLGTMYSSPFMPGGPNLSAAISAWGLGACTLFFGGSARRLFFFD